MPVTQRSDEPRRHTIRRVSDGASADGQILEQIRDLTSQLEIHLADEKKRSEIVDSIYKLFVTGNGVPSFQEKVRTLEGWVDGIKKMLMAGGLIILGYILTRLKEVLYP